MVTYHGIPLHHWSKNCNTMVHHVSSCQDLNKYILILGYIVRNMSLGLSPLSTRKNAEHLSSFSCKGIHKGLIFHLLSSSERLHNIPVPSHFIFSSDSSAYVHSFHKSNIHQTTILHHSSVTLQTRSETRIRVL